MLLSGSRRWLQLGQEWDVAASCSFDLPLFDETSPLHFFTPLLHSSSSLISTIFIYFVLSRSPVTLAKSRWVIVSPRGQYKALGWFMLNGGWWNKFWGQTDLLLPWSRRLLPFVWHLLLWNLLFARWSHDWTTVNLQSLGGIGQIHLVVTFRSRFGLRCFIKTFHQLFFFLKCLFDVRNS